MSKHNQIHKDGVDPGGGRPGHSSYWKFAHRDWRFWLGLVLICAAMAIYLLTEDLSVRPGPQPAQLQSGAVGGK